MEERKKEYNGIWKTMGCLLSLVAIFGIFFLLGLGMYYLIMGF